MELPSFSFIPHENMRIMLMDAMEAITLSKSWEWLCNYPDNKGFMFVRDKHVNKIKRIMLYKDHNDVSFGIVMSHMEYIAKYGWEGYMRRFKT